MPHRNPIAVFRRIVLYILLIMTILAAVMHMLTDHSSNFSHSILEPIKINRGSTEFDYLQATGFFPSGVGPVYLRSYHFRGGADFMQLNMSEKDMKKYIRKRKRNKNYRVRKLPISNDCMRTYDLAKYNFRVKRGFLPNLDSRNVRYGSIKNDGDGRILYCRELDVFDLEKGHVWYIKRTLK